MRGAAEHNGHSPAPRVDAPPQLPPLPQNVEAEEAVIGAILFSGRCLGAVRPLLEPGDFYHPAHAPIFEALIALEAAAQPIDIITAAAQMRTADTLGKLRMQGGEAYLAELSSKVATVENIEHHARLVKRAALQRRGILARRAGYDRALAGLDTAEQDREIEEVRQALEELDGHARPPLRMVRICDVPEPGPARWLVRSWWTVGALGFVGAEPKSWKSWVTLILAIAVAGGRPAFGRYDVTPGRVLLYSVEGGSGEARRRIGAICRALGIDIRSLDLDLIDVPGLRLDDARHVADLARTVEMVRPALLILDPLRNLHGSDENDSAAIAGLLAPLLTLRDRTGCAIMIVHHSVKAPTDGSGRKRGGQRLRGSSALHGASDSALYLTTDGEGDDKRVKVEAEHRAAPSPEPITLAMREHHGPDGLATWLEIIEEKGDSEEQETEREIDARERDRRKILRVIRLASMPGRTPLRSKAALARTAKMRPATAGPLIDELLKQGAVVVDENGAWRCKDE